MLLGLQHAALLGHAERSELINSALQTFFSLLFVFLLCLTPQAGFWMGGFCCCPSRGRQLDGSPVSLRDREPSSPLRDTLGTLR